MTGMEKRHLILNSGNSFSSHFPSSYIFEDSTNFVNKIFPFFLFISAIKSSKQAFVVDRPLVEKETKKYRRKQVYDFYGIISFLFRCQKLFFCRDST